MPDKLPIKLKRIRSRLDREERTYQILKDAVVHRQFGPGVWVQQEQVCQAIGTSRTPIRQALARLQSEGLIEARPRKGFRVVEFSEKELDDLFEVREIVETSMFERSARGISKDELKNIFRDLQKTEREMKEAVADPELWDRKLRVFLNADRSFHDRLIEATQNEQWIQVYLNIRDKISIVGYQASYIPEQLSSAIDEHHRIIEAMMRHDVGEARTLLREHIRNVRRSIKSGGGESELLKPS